MSKPVILLGRRQSEDPRRGYAELFVELLQREGCDVVWERDVEEDESILSKVEGIISAWRFPSSLFDKSKDAFPKLKIISRCGAGVDRIDVAGWRERGVVVTNSPEATGDATADLAVALALAASRRLVEGVEIAKSGDWTRWEGLGVDLSGAVVGIVGMGNVGIKVARRMKAFDCKILYHNRHRRSAADESTVGGETVFCSTLLELCRQADFIVVCCLLNEQTRHLITTQHFESMKTSAIFINVARGQVVDQDALLAALQSRKIRCAALDVMTPEPLPSDHPLQRLDNCILTPHIGTATEGARKKMIVQSVENVVRGINGEKLRNVVE